MRRKRFRFVYQTAHVFLQGGVCVGKGVQGVHGVVQSSEVILLQLIIPKQIITLHSPLSYTYSIGIVHSPLSPLQFSIYHHFGANQVLHFGSNPPFTTTYSTSSFLANKDNPIQTRQLWEDRTLLSTVGLLGDIRALYAKPRPEISGSWTGVH